MTSLAEIRVAGTRVAGLFVLDERMSARVLAPTPPHHGCPLPVGRER
jgi:hypothetical protein